MSSLFSRPSLTRSFRSHKSSSSVGSTQSVSLESPGMTSTALDENVIEDDTLGPMDISNMNPLDLYGQVSIPGNGSLLIPGRTREGGGMARVVLQENHIRFHTFFNEHGFHNHTAHHILASYSLGAQAELIKDIYDLHEPRMKEMLPFQPIEMTEHNWKEFLGDESFYPNYLAFFTSQIAQTSSAAALDKYLTDPDGQMLTRSVSGAIHPLIHIGHGTEFELDALAAEGLAQCAVHDPRVASLFPETWPPQPPPPTLFSNITSTFSSTFSSISNTGTHPEKADSDYTSSGHPATSTGQHHRRESQSREKSGGGGRGGGGGGSSNQQPVSFLATSLRLPRSGSRLPRKGLSALTIVSHVLQSPTLGPGSANQRDSFPRLDVALQNCSADIVELCENWIIDEDGGWEEIVEKCEELFWCATVLLTGATRPGREIRLDFFMMHALTSVLFLPSILEGLSAHLRPFILHSHFRVMIAYWISRGRPAIHVKNVMAQTDRPAPPQTFTSGNRAVKNAVERQRKDREEQAAEAAKVADVAAETAEATQFVDADEGELDASAESKAEREGEHKEEENPVESEGEKTSKKPTSAKTSTDTSNPWGSIIASAADHPDEHTTKTIRSLAFAASLWGTSPPGMLRCSLEGSDVLDGSIFIRAAGMVMAALGWVREGEDEGNWDRSVLGFDESWEEEAQE